MKPAPKENLALISRDYVTPRTVLTRSGAARNISTPTAQFLERARIIYRLGKGANPQQTLIECKPETWTDLQTEAATVYINFSHGLSDVYPDLAPRIQHAGVAAAGQIGAILEMMPHIARRDNYNGTSAALARKSGEFALTWAALSSDADADLTYALSQPHPNLTDDDMATYCGLRFNPDFFVIDDRGSVTWDMNAIPILRNEKNKSINNRAKGTDVYFGCPMRPRIPQLYTAMTNAAIRGGLLEV